MVYSYPKFGWSVATKGNYLIAGAPEEYYGDSSTTRTGLAYLYEYNETTNSWRKSKYNFEAFRDSR